MSDISMMNIRMSNMEQLKLTWTLAFIVCLQLMANGQSYFLRDYHPNFGLEITNTVGIAQIKDVRSGGFYSGSTVYVFNADGQLETARSYTSKGVLQPSSSITVNYDGSGRIQTKVNGSDTLVFTYNGDGQIHTIQYPFSKYTYAYHEDGRLRSVTITDKNDAEISTVVWRCNEKGWILKESVYEQGELVSFLSYELSEAGFRLTEVGQNKTIQRQFDEYGNTTLRKEIKSTSAKTSTTVYTYAYDEHGNWIKKTVVKNGRTIKAVAREITYREQ